MGNGNKAEQAGRTIMSIIVRLSGLILLFAGLWVAFQVLTEALDLYRDPQKIERFAVAIERGSNIDKSLTALQNTSTDSSIDEKLVGERERNISNDNKKNDIRISYFLAWIIVLLLLLMIARIALAAIKAGGELVLYDVQIKQFAKSLIKEAAKANKSGE